MQNIVDSLLMAHVHYTVQGTMGYTKWMRVKLELTGNVAVIYRYKFKSPGEESMKSRKQERDRIADPEKRRSPDSAREEAYV